MATLKMGRLLRTEQEGKIGLRYSTNTSVAHFVGKMGETMRPGVQNLHDVMQRIFENATLWAARDVHHPTSKPSPPCVPDSTISSSSMRSK